MPSHQGPLLDHLERVGACVNPLAGAPPPVHPIHAQTCGRVCTTVIAPSGATTPSMSWGMPSRAASIDAPTLQISDRRCLRNPGSCEGEEGEQIVRWGARRDQGPAGEEEGRGGEREFPKGTGVALAREPLTHVSQ